MNNERIAGMEHNEPEDFTRGFEDAASRAESEHYMLTLYITGATPQSAQAVKRAKEICETHLQGRYELQVVDIYQQPELAKGAQILAAPTLIKSLPLPLRRLIGNLSDLQRVLVGLGLEPKA